MEIVIKIDEELYDSIQYELNWDKVLEQNDIRNLLLAVGDGVILPKGHGDIIDRNELAFLTAIHDAKFEKISWSDAIRKIKYSAPTIVKGVI